MNDLRKGLSGLQTEADIGLISTDRGGRRSIRLPTGADTG